MKSLWNNLDARKLGKGLLSQRVYSSRLLGANANLVLHGGGNTSVKVSEKDFFGNLSEILYVKGSGHDLASITKDGFSPCRMNELLQLAQMDSLTDSEMVAQCSAAMLDVQAPRPSIEALVHAVIPRRFVDHTHADAVVAITNTPNAKDKIREIYGDRVLVVPYVMPGFELAKAVRRILDGADLDRVEGMILMNHGVFTFHDDVRKSYELMIKLATQAERYIKANLPKRKKPAGAGGRLKEDLPAISILRRCVAEHRGVPVYACIDQSKEAIAFSRLKNIDSIARSGPLTPDHVIRTKRIPALIGSDVERSVSVFANRYTRYFNNFSNGDLAMLDPAPRWAIWPGYGVVSFGATLKETGIVADIARHTLISIGHAEQALGGWKPLPASKLFDIEYWELEQAKLKASAAHHFAHLGKVAIVSGSAAGIGFACAKALAEDGAAVVGLDLNPDIVSQMEEIGAKGMVVNLTDEGQVVAAVEETIRKFGGLDIVVSNAGIFTAGAYLQDMDQSNWDKSIAVNLTSHQVLLKHSIPYVKQGLDGSIVLVGSRNVNAPGAGAASYSCAKAGLTQLCRVAALELAPFGVRCNIVHPDAVFDTKLWTPQALKRSAERYGITVEEYKTRNLLKAEIKSADVGAMVSAMAGKVFAKTTGAQVPVDGGNDRVI